MPRLELEDHVRERAPMVPDIGEVNMHTIVHRFLWCVATGCLFSRIFTSRYDARRGTEKHFFLFCFAERLRSIPYVRCGSLAI